HLEALVRLLEAAEFGVVLLETVGAGQGDTMVRALADVLVLLLQPETGDDLQWEKAGLLEVADVIVIHKADLPGADRVQAQVLAAFAVPKAPRVRVRRVSGGTGGGVPELWRPIAAAPLRRGTRRDAGELLRLARELLAVRFGARRDELAGLLARWQRGE